MKAGGMKLKVREFSLGRGRSIGFWNGEECVATISWIYIDGSNGVAFARNYSSKPAHISVRAGLGGAEEMLHEGRSERVFTRNEADKAARAYIREHDLRGMVRRWFENQATLAT
jgi:hypothetical protein